MKQASPEIRCNFLSILDEGKKVFNKNLIFFSVKFKFYRNFVAFLRNLVEDQTKMSIPKIRRFCRLFFSKNLLHLGGPFRRNPHPRLLR